MEAEWRGNGRMAVACRGSEHRFGAINPPLGTRLAAHETLSNHLWSVAQRESKPLRAWHGPPSWHRDDRSDAFHVSGSLLYHTAKR